MTPREQTRGGLTHVEGVVVDYLERKRLCCGSIPRAKKLHLHGDTKKSNSRHRLLPSACGWPRERFLSWVANERPVFFRVKDLKREGYVFQAHVDHRRNRGLPPTGGT